MRISLDRRGLCGGWDHRGRPFRAAQWQRQPGKSRTYPYVDESGTLLFEVVRFAPKDFRQRKPDGNGGWEWKLGKRRAASSTGCPRSLRPLRPAASGVWWRARKTCSRCDNYVTATCNAGGAGKWRAEYSESLRGAQVAKLWDADEPGRKHAREVAASLQGKAASVKLLEPPEGSKDVSEHLAAGAGKLSELVEMEAPSTGRGSPLQPAHHRQTGGSADCIASTIRRYVVVSDAQRDAVALWVLHAHAIGAADTTPYLDISSAEKQSGKSRLLEVLAQLTPRTMEAANVADAALFRALSGDDGPATLLYDEVDVLFGRGVSTSKRGATRVAERGLSTRCWLAWRCEGDGSKQTVTPYPVFGAKASAGIGELPETLADRSIPFWPRRCRPDERRSSAADTRSSPLTARP